jgi:hypothetical protein
LTRNGWSGVEADGAIAPMAISLLLSSAIVAERLR